MEQETENKIPLMPQDDHEDVSDKLPSIPENAEAGEESEEVEAKHSLHFPRLILKLGVWPVNIGLFFFYNNVVSLVVLLIGLIIMSSTGVDDQTIITQKLGGLSVISTIITLGLTLIYSRKFYFTKNY